MQAHQTAVELFAAEATRPSGPVVDELAGQLLPTLRQQLEMAQQISQSLG